MALVMLPSDFPWWNTVDKKLQAIQESDNINIIFDHMQKIHDLCNVSLDPDDDDKDCTFLDGLKKTFDENFKFDDIRTSLEDIIKIIAKRAQNVKNLRPPRGLSFSLQQQVDNIAISRNFVIALLANAFFSTFPKRTEKTHPTLQDFNFTNFFRNLESKTQKAKLRCLFYYFDWINQQENDFEDEIHFYRKVMPGKQWLTIEDWLECSFPLCPVDVKHQGRIENCFGDAVQAVFSSARIGGKSLKGGQTQESLQLFTSPEALVTLLFFEALEDNEALLITGVYHIGTVIDPKNKSIVEFLPKPRQISLCCYDAENYLVLPISQFEEDNILRELNKCLLAFRQNSTCKIAEMREKRLRKGNNNTRLSPIGESGSSSPHDVVPTTIIINQPSTSSSFSVSEKAEEDEKRKKRWLTAAAVTKGPVLSKSSGVERRGRFIVLGSSGECLPVNRRSQYSCNSSNCGHSGESEEEFHSAKSSFEESDDEEVFKYASKELNTPEKRRSFIVKLQEALKQSSNYTESTASSYAVGISLSGSQDGEEILRLRRGGSTGFALAEDSFDEEYYKPFFEQEHWLNNGKDLVVQKRNIRDSSKYSFSTDCSSDLDEVLERFSKWLDDPKTDDEDKITDPRTEAIINFASSLLKRTLSESFVGVPLTEGCVSSVETSTEDTLIQDYKNKKMRPVLNAKSLSLELAKFRHQVTDHLLKKRQHVGNLYPVATGNWGCGSSQCGNIQLKMVIQWLAASMADLPYLIYYTNGHYELTKLDTLIRVLRDRKWTVGALANETLKYAKEFIEYPNDVTKDSRDFFERLLGI